MKFFVTITGLITGDILGIAAGLKKAIAPKARVLKVKNENFTP
jgi:hypothetical protein